MNDPIKIAIHTAHDGTITPIAVTRYAHATFPDLTIGRLFPGEGSELTRWVNAIRTLLGEHRPIRGLGILEVDRDGFREVRRMTPHDLFDLARSIEGRDGPYAMMDLPVTR